MTELDSALAQDPEVFRQSFLDSNDAIVITDADGRILLANPAWVKLYGYSLAEARGRTTRLIKGDHTPREMYDYMWSQIKDPAKGYWKGEVINKTRDGREVALLLTITPIRRDGEIAGYMGLGIDMTERRRLDEMHELHDAIVRHDLKAPLATLTTLLDTLGGGYVGKLSDEQRTLIERMGGQADRMLEMIRSSLDVEKVKRGQLQLNLEDVDLAKLVRASFDTLAAQAERKRVRLELREEGVLPALQLDPVHLQRCTDNLIKNAIEASPRDDEITVTLRAEGATARVEVHNGGDPIPPDIRPYLFHAFSTYGKRGGTGLGVYGVKLLTDAMGGSVSYETGENGTTFTLDFGGK